MQRTANAIWHGSITRGQGEITTSSEILKSVPYSFSTRFGQSPGTNPEELIAAAHASCFAMACSAALSAKKFEPDFLDVVSNLTLDKQGDSWTVTASHLTLHARVPNIDDAQFQTIVKDAKENCPISKLLKAEITLDAKLDEATMKPWAPPPPQ